MTWIGPHFATLFAGDVAGRFVGRAKTLCLPRMLSTLRILRGLRDGTGRSRRTDGHCGLRRWWAMACQPDSSSVDSGLAVGRVYRGADYRARRPRRNFRRPPFPCGVPRHWFVVVRQRDVTQIVGSIDRSATVLRLVTLGVLVTWIVGSVTASLVTNLHPISLCCSVQYWWSRDPRW